MDYAKYWASAVATADLGETIDQSLRFRGTQSLTKTLGTATTWTCSFWVKRSALSIDATGPQQTISFNNGVTQHRFQETNAFLLGDAAISAELFRDPSAWYHVVSRSNGSTSEAWINNNQLTFSPAPGARTGGGVTSIGIFSTTELDGYLAEVNFLETHLSPTDFARYNDDGVWVPTTPSFTAAQYGANGFRLTFDSSQTNADIGEDSAPIGASGHTARNDFTASGFDTGAIASYGGTIFTDSVNTGASATPNISSTASTFTNAFTNVFDGSTSTRIYTGVAGSWIIFRPSTAIPMSSGLRIWAEGAYVGQVWLNGSNSSFTSTGTTTWQTIPIGSETQITSIAIQGKTSPAAGATLFAIEVDGTILVHNTDNDVDYPDTPTSNYSTWNPIHTAEGNKGNFTNANLQLANSSGGDYIAPSTIACGDGHWYWEVTIDGVQSTGYPMIGILDYESAKPEWGGGTANTEGCLYWTTGQFSAFVAQGSQSSYGATFTTGDIIGVEYNGSNGQLTFYKNGVSQGLATTVASSRRADMIPGVSAGHNGSAIVSVNFGQMDFIYTVPTGASSLQTNNLPEPTIKNGKEHFDTVTYTGSSSAKTVTGLEFQPDLIWFKSTSHSTSHALFDSVRGTSPGYLMSDDAGAEETSNGTLTSFNSDGFTTGVPVLNEYNNGGGRTYVAWCWKAGGAAVSNGNGSITSSVSANTDAGFSIVSYTGNLTAGATVGHGLTTAPDLIMVKARDFSQTWHVKHSSIGNNTDSLSLDTTAAGINYNAWNNTAPTSSVFSLGPINGTNKSGNDYIAYCWHSVEGFSKFGSFSGNADADGTFVYLGFRPSLIIWKSTSSGTDWQMRDIERDGNVNPVNLTLYPNVNSSEYSGGSADVDFLSNGFKMRTGDTNVNGGTMLYMAWAEHPFGGENVPPATAR
jgi:hypothetical protein